MSTHRHSGPADEDCPDFGYGDHRRLLRRIIAGYDSAIVRAYCFVRFIIININMLHILRLCMRGKTRVLEIGCGFGLFGCYFAARDPRIEYRGIDIDPKRIEMARRAAKRIDLKNVEFQVGDARTLRAPDGEFDIIMMMDLMHHVPDDSKRRLLATLLPHLRADGRLIIKEISRRPAWKLFFTWLLDVLMTRGFDMWYWNPGDFRAAIPSSYELEIYPIADLLPYPHVVYLFSREGRTGGAPAPGLMSHVTASVPPEWQTS